MNDYERVLQSVAECKEAIKEVHLLLVGDKIKKQAGVLDILDTHRREIYGDEETRFIGLKQSFDGLKTKIDNQLASQHQRIQSLENDRIKVMAWCGAAAFFVSLLWNLSKEFIFK